MLADPQWAAELDGSFALRVNGAGGGDWVFNCRNPVSIKEGATKADCVCFIDSNDLIDLMNGRLNPQVAYLQGKMKLEGDTFLALKFSELFGIAD